MRYTNAFVHPGIKYDRSYLLEYSRHFETLFVYNFTRFKSEILKAIQNQIQHTEYNIPPRHTNVGNTNLENIQTNAKNRKRKSPSSKKT